MDYNEVNRLIVLALAEVGMAAHYIVESETSISYPPESRECMGWAREAAEKAQAHVTALHKVLQEAAAGKEKAG